MSQYPPASFDQPRPLSTGLAIGALVCGICGLCIPGLGLVGIILGIVALSKAGSSPQTHGGKGMAIAGIVVGALSFIFVFLSIGIMLPALGKARESARQLKSSVQLRSIDVALLRYASDNKGWLPEAGADWQSRLSAYSVSQDTFTSPRSEDASPADSYIYVPGHHMGGQGENTTTIIAYENPKYVRRGVVSVAYADGHVEAVPLNQLQQTLDRAPKPENAPAPKKPGAKP